MNRVTSRFIKRVMTDIDTIIDRICTFARRRGNKARLARETGVSQPLLTKLGSGSWNPTADTIRSLDAAVIKLSAETPNNAQSRD